METPTLYHGTTAKYAKEIERVGFIPDLHHNWEVPSKTGFVYLSTAYAPFYANTADAGNDAMTGELALIKCTVDISDLYPDDDFIMQCFGKKTYTQDDLDEIELDDYKQHWRKSIESLGTVATKPGDIKIDGIRYFSGRKLLYKSDPSICPMNYKFMGDYYIRLSEWIYGGKNIMDFDNERISSLSLRE